MSALTRQKDFLAGLFFLAVSGIFTWGLLELPVGRASQMGPGYFPLVLIVLLTILGVLLMINGFRTAGEPLSSISLRAPALVILPILFFGWSLPKLGLVPSLGIALFVTTLAAPDRRLLSSLYITVTIVALSWIIFIWALGLPIPSLGPWLRGY